MHLIFFRGEGTKGQPAFRESFSKLGELRSIVPEGTPVLALTASAETKHRDRVTKLLHMEAATQVTVSPNRQNIRLGLGSLSPNNLSSLDWLVEMIKEKELSLPHVIIYCRTLKTVGRVFCHLKAELGENAWVDKDHKSDNLIIGMFHSNTLPQNKERVLKSLNGEGNCKIIVATTALGMGLNFPNVSHVVLYGSPEDVEAIVQQVGRAGRHGQQSHAILYIQATRDDAVKDVVAKAKKSCFRQALFSYFENDTQSVKPGHLCCTFCHSQCLCERNGCPEPIPLYETLVNVKSPPQKSRNVTSSDKQLVQDLLEEYMESLGSQTKQVFTSKAMCTGFSVDLIVAVLEHCPFIFDLNYIISNLPVFRVEHAREILTIISEVFGDIDSAQAVQEEECLDLDINFLGYFDEEDDDFEITTQYSSQESLFM
ncbi:hypothetical protein WMY93_002923 [Mugilogobius chulae]|uniref:DNA 3'-5' helicase n=1 Tax=Mugilogobius chulae TaxID=88201 RepID=A0AAW0Q5V4_9GOBI